MVLLLRKLYLYLTKDPLFSGGGGGGGPTFSRGGGGGVKMLISIETIYILVIFQGECPDPLSPSGSAHGQCHHNGTIFMTVRPLTIIVRH